MSLFSLYFPRTASNLIKNYAGRSTFYQLQGRYPSVFIHQSAYIFSRIIPFKLSDIGEGIREVVIKEWYVKEGDRVAQFDNICEVQSDKASVTITSRYDGLIKKVNFAVEEMAKVGEALVDVEVEEEDDRTEKNIEHISSSLQIKEAPKKVEKQRPLAIPAVRRIAKENNVDLEKLQATGKGGRVLKEDILSYLKDKSSLDEVNSQAYERHSNQSDLIEPIKGYRKAMVKTMTASLKIPHMGLSEEIQLTALVLLRKKINDLLKSQTQPTLSFVAFFVKAASIALIDFPILNAQVDENCHNIIYKTDHNIGVAIDTINGLIVPNVKKVQNLSVMDLNKELTRLQNDAKHGGVKPEDLSGGTFTLSNIGSIGGTYANPIILPPEIAIGAIGRSQMIHKMNEHGQVKSEYICHVSWSADHRIIDGATLTRFSNKWKYLLENPEMILIFKA